MEERCRWEGKWVELKEDMNVGLWCIGIWEWWVVGNVERRAFKAIGEEISNKILPKTLLKTCCCHELWYEIEICRLPGRIMMLKWCYTLKKRSAKCSLTPRGPKLRAQHRTNQKRFPSILNLDMLPHWHQYHAVLDSFWNGYKYLFWTYNSDLSKDSMNYSDCCWPELPQNLSVWHKKLSETHLFALDSTVNHQQEGFCPLKIFLKL